MKTTAARPQTGQVWVCRDGRTLEPDFLVAGDVGGVAAGLVPFGGATGGLATAAGFSFNSGTSALAAPGAVAAVGAISTTDTTASSSTSTGSGKFGGGVGITGAVWVGGLINSASTITGTQLISTVATGTAPLSVTSTTVVPNLNVSQLLGNTWASPGPIGGTTPGTGAFTTLSASGAASFTSGTAATSTSTGAVVLTGSGGLGVGGAAYIGGTLHTEGGAIDFPTTLTVTARTSDGADNGRLLFGGGGAISNSRGAYIAVQGNEYSSNPGSFFCQLGDATGAFFQVGGNAVGSLVITNTNLIGLYGATATAQYSTTGTTTGFVAGVGTAAKSDSTYTGNTGSTAYTNGDVVRALKLIGILAA